MAASRRKSTASRGRPPRQSAALDRSVASRPPAPAAFDSSPPVYEVRAAASRIFDSSDDLLSRARMQWQFGEWRALLGLDLLAIEHHPNRAELALLSGCAAFQTGLTDVAQRYLAAAQAWDCNPALMARLLLAGVANSLARYHDLRGNSSISDTYFLEAASALGGDPRLAARARQQQERLSLRAHHSTAHGTLAVPPLEPSPRLAEPTTAAPATRSTPFAHANQPTEPEVNPFQPGIRSCAQNFEDVMLWRALKHIEDGLYIDVGAQHLATAPIIKALNDRGWRGIHVDTSDNYAIVLEKRRPTEGVRDAAAPHTDGIFDTYKIDGAEFRSGSVGIAKMHHGSDSTTRQGRLPTVSVDEILAYAVAHGANAVHFMKIDNQGKEVEVLRGWKAKNLPRPWILMVGSAAPCSQFLPKDIVDDMLAANNYTFAFSCGLLRCYVATEHATLLVP